MKMDKLILAADVGGTKTLMRLFDEDKGIPYEVQTKKFVSSHFDSIPT